MKRLTTFDISGLIGESEYTVRTVANQYVMYLPSTRIGSERFFPPDAVEVFRLIVEQLAVGVREEYIEMMLGKRFPMAEVSVTGNAVDVAFHQPRPEPAALASRDAWRSAALTSAAPGERQPLPVTPVARPAARDAIDAGADGLAAQVRAMQQRIDELENQVHTFDAGRPTPPVRPANEPARPSAAPSATRRGFDDLAGRDSRAGD